MVLGVAALGVAFTAFTALLPRLERGAARREEQRWRDVLAGPSQRFFEATRIADQAARSGDYSTVVRGKPVALELLRTKDGFRFDWNYGNAVHYANLVLGRIALHDDDLAAARQYLLAAGDTPGSPQLRDYGPDMTLAAEMLNRGETETVLRYFELCDRFWLNRDRNRIKEWSAAVRSGRPPDFGASSGLQVPAS